MGNFLLLGDLIKITNWLTPVWFLSVGISLGFLLIILAIMLIKALQPVSRLNAIAESKGSWIVAGGISTLLLAAGGMGLILWQSPSFFSEYENPIGLAVVLVLFLSLFFGFGFWKLIGRRFRPEMDDLLFDGLLIWVNRIFVGLALFAVIGVLLDWVNGFGIVTVVKDTNGIFESLKRLPQLGEFERTVTVPSSDFESVGEQVDVSFVGSELVLMSILSNRRLEVSAFPITAETTPGDFFAVEPTDGDPLLYMRRADGTGPIPEGQIDHLFVKNLGRDPATVTFKYTLAPVYREVSLIPKTALIVFICYLGFMIFPTFCPKIYAIAFSTFKTEVGQPLFWFITGMVGLFLLVTLFIPYNTFGDDIKMYTDSGLTFIRVAAIFLAIWAASKSVAEEIEGRTALTVLSKPVGRRQFIIGKFTGISMAIGLMFMFVGLWFFIWVAFKPIYDFQEASKGLAEWTVCFEEATSVLPGLFLSFLQGIIFVGISIAISTRMGMLGNFLICFAIYVNGHLTPLLVQSQLGSFEIVAFFSQITAVVFPVLANYDVQSAIAKNAVVPFSYLGWTTVYTLIYSTLSLVVALILFEDRDLA